YGGPLPGPGPGAARPGPAPGARRPGEAPPRGPRRRGRRRRALVRRVAAFFRTRARQTRLRPNAGTTRPRSGERGYATHRGGCLMPVTAPAFNEEQALSRLLRFLAVEGVTGQEKAIGEAVLRDLVESGVPRATINYDQADERIDLPTETG